MRGCASFREGSSDGWDGGAALIFSAVIKLGNNEYTYELTSHVRTKRMDEALRDAITYGHADECEVLLLSGSRAHVVDEESGSPLHLAAAVNESEVASLLLDHGAQINFQDHNGDTALHVAFVSQKLFDFSHRFTHVEYFWIGIR